MPWVLFLFFLRRNFSITSLNTYILPQPLYIVKSILFQTTKVCKIFSINDSYAFVGEVFDLNR